MGSLLACLIRGMLHRVIDTILADVCAAALIETMFRRAPSRAEPSQPASECLTSVCNEIAAQCRWRVKTFNASTSRRLVTGCYADDG